MAILPDPVDGGLYTRLADSSIIAMTTSSAPLISGEATSFLATGASGPNIVRVELSIDNGDWQLAQAADGTFDSNDEGFTFDSRLTAGQHTVKARAVDATGKVEQHLALMTFSIANQRSIYLPLVIR
jgi:hypothetical protein